MINAHHCLHHGSYRELAETAIERQAVVHPLVYNLRYGEDGKPLMRRKYSDVLLIFRLKALKPNMYADFSCNRTDTNVNITSSIEHKHIREMNEAERLEAAKQLNAQRHAPKLPLVVLPAGRILLASVEMHTETLGREHFLQ